MEYFVVSNILINEIKLMPGYSMGDEYMTKPYVLYKRKKKRIF